MKLKLSDSNAFVSTHRPLRLMTGLILAMVAWTVGPVQAHVVIASQSAVAGSHVKVVLQVPHGCGRSATTGLSVSVPVGLLVAKPMPKPGWRLTTETAKLPEPVRMHGKTVTESTSSIRWDGGNLPNEFFDEFVIFGKLASDSAGRLVFKTSQTCGEEQVDWNGEPGSAHPAPSLTVEAPPAADRSGHVH